MRVGAAVFLVVLGTAQMIGDLLGFLPLKAIAAATGASPAPKVFSAVQGLETYSTRFFLDLGDRRVEVTPKLYSRIRGPYNRRNVFGAALAYGPVLPPELREPVLHYALCGDAPMLRELGLQSTGTVAVELEPLPGTSLGTMQTRFEADCR
ncbi:MAG TPA: hypothetical protein VGQ76_26425 [Thermoanaerobaculia bacterium]|jgi:hypothetical protein|nr:hypothetical protein [Thermoanaerobaculia bacterium]